MPSVRVGDIDIAYDRRGEGPPLLMVAGTGSPGYWLSRTIERLATEFTVISYDHRGTGSTPGTPGSYSTRQFAADALGLLRALKTGPAHVFGHSMGGRVGQWMALDGADEVRSLILAASGPGQFRPDKPQQAGIPVAVAHALATNGYERYIRDHMGDFLFTPEFASEHPEVIEARIRGWWAARPSLEDYLKHVAARQEHQTAELLPGIRCPTLVAVGSRDDKMLGTGSHVEQSRFLAERIPRSRLIVFDGLAHEFFWEDPDGTWDVMAAWLRDPNAALREAAAGDAV